jgi:microcystin degradation protein MlrC
VPPTRVVEQFGQPCWISEGRTHPDSFVADAPLCFVAATERVLPRWWAIPAERSTAATYRGGMRRVGIIGLEHETNTFRPETTPLDAFTISRGDEILVERGRRTYAAGMMDGLDEAGIEVVPLMIAGAQPSGSIAADAYAALRADLVAAALAAPVDGLLVQLHGAGVAEGVDDVEADLGEALRAAVGADVPIVGTLDLHANLLPATAAPFDALSCVKFYPHTDMYDRGREAAQMVARLLGGERFHLHVEPLPWLLLPTATSVDGPAEAIRICDEAERLPGVVDATFVHGFPLADGPQCRASVIVVTERGRADAGEVAASLADRIWELRRRFDVAMHPPHEAVAVALDSLSADAGGPVVVAETSDNPGGGGVGDGTHLLRALLDAGAAGVFGSIVDPAVAALAHESGVGARFQVALGGRLDTTSGEPIECVVDVVALSDGRYEVRGVGWQVDLGPSALVRIDGMLVVVTTGNQQVFDDGPFTIHGIDVRRQSLVALKSANHFRAYYQRFARAIVPVLGPGLSAQTTTLPWERVRRPIWPLDLDVER